jgi:FkbM family methyltransferase
VLQRLWKPWFVYRPSQLVKRLLLSVSSQGQGFTPLQTSWGAEVLADPGRTIGRSIVTTGLYDLAVSEALFRLISPGDTVIDAGANIGYMSVLVGVAAGPQGKVISFEPHPELFGILQRNVAEVSQRWKVATFQLHQSALGEESGTAQLELPEDFEKNDGIAKIGSTANSGGRSISVPIATLDELLGNVSVSVMKIDVEGFEPQVLRGAKTLLQERRIQHILFEDHSISNSPVVTILREAGYKLFSLGWSMQGLLVQPIEVGSLATHYEAPNFIATQNSEDLLARCQPKGWLSLGKRTVPR